MTWHHAVGPIGVRSAVGHVTFTHHQGLAADEHRTGTKRLTTRYQAAVVCPSDFCISVGKLTTDATQRHKRGPCQVFAGPVDDSAYLSDSPSKAEFG